MTIQTRTPIGLDGVAAAETVLSHVDGEKGELIIAGDHVGRLARSTGFEGVTARLWSAGSGVPNDAGVVQQLLQASHRYVPTAHSVPSFPRRDPDATRPRRHGIRPGRRAAWPVRRLGACGSARRGCLAAVRSARLCSVTSRPRSKITTLPTVWATSARMWLVSSGRERFLT